VRHEMPAAPRRAPVPQVGEEALGQAPGEVHVISACFARR
jgi:hypothetical protein